LVIESIPTSKEPAVTHSFFQTRLAALFLIAAAATPALAQGDGGVPTVNTQGFASIKKQPDTLRMSMQVQVTGKDLKDALANLTARKETLRKQLAELGATKESIEFTPPSAGGDQRQRQMEMMVRMRMQSGGGKQPEESGKPVALAATVKADWPLKAGEPEQLLLAANDLQEKLKAASGSTTKPADNLTAEQREELEEMMSMNDNDEGAAPGTPIFLYVARISDEERAKALSEAFGKAKAEAGRLAVAAGGKAGGLRQLSSHSGPDTSGYDFDYENRALYQMMLQDQRQGGESNEAIGTQPGPVTFQAMVNASFQLQ
jgi:uncharacterized protein YggE